MDRNATEMREEVTGTTEEADAQAAERQAAGGDSPAAEVAASDDMSGVRELILQAYPDVVAELLSGESVEALLASIPAARAAYAQVAAAIQEQRPQPAPIPTGSGRRPAVDPEGLSPEAMIQAGLRRASL